MKSLFAFMKKEWLETVRSGKIVILVILFVLFGIMNPAVAKLTPWLMETLADSLAEAGMIVTAVQVDALTSWTQFFKNIPIGLIAFVLIYSNTFTKEYQSGTLVLMLTKGLARCRVVLSKAALMLLFWTFCYLLSFAVTYGYNAYFWDNSIACHLLPAVANWWLFGVWVISLIVISSALSSSNTSVILGTGAIVLASYFAGFFPKLQQYTPTLLINTASLLSGSEGLDAYVKAVVITVVLCVICIAASIPIMNKRQI